METMDNLLNSAIRDVIDAYPDVGTVLEQHGVGCVTCQVGTCLLKDIVTIHDLSPEDEEAVMWGIAAAVATPEQSAGAETAANESAVTPTAAATPAPTAPAGAPTRRLMAEHRLIERLVALVPDVAGALDLDRAADRRLVLDGLDFIRSYADRYHHAKEEDILFGYFDQASPVVRAFRSEHEMARGYVQQAEMAVQARDRAAVAENLLAYATLLSSHIKREDGILYPWMDRELSPSQADEILSRFAAVDAAAGPSFTPSYVDLVDRIDAWTTGVPYPELPAAAMAGGHTTNKKAEA